jgi:hypothetical protein
MTLKENFQEARTLWAVLWKWPTGFGSPVYGMSVAFWNKRGQNIHFHWSV